MPPGRGGIPRLTLAEDLGPARGVRGGALARRQRVAAHLRAHLRRRWPRRPRRQAGADARRWDGDREPVPLRRRPVPGGPSTSRTSSGRARPACADMPRQFAQTLDDLRAPANGRRASEAVRPARHAAPRTSPRTTSTPRSCGSAASTSATCGGCGWSRRRARGRGLDLDAYSGVILGGSPFTTSAPAGQVRGPAAGRGATSPRCSTGWSRRTGPSWGPATASAPSAPPGRGRRRHLRASRSARSRSSSPPTGRSDPLTSALPGTFEAFVGHKEAVTPLPPVRCCSPRRRPARCRRSGWAATSTPRSSTPSSTCRGSQPHRRLQALGYFEPHEAEWLKAGAAQARGERAAPAAGSASSSSTPAELR